MSEMVPMLLFDNYMPHLIVPFAIVASVSIAWTVWAVGLRLSFNRRQQAAVPPGEIECRGQDCLLQLKTVNNHLKFYKISTFVVPVVMIAVYTAVRSLDGTDRWPMAEMIGLALFAVPLMFCIVFSWVRMTDTRNFARLIHEGRLATRRVLDPILKDRYIVLHDVVGNQFSIDHLVVGPKGVFAIQTCAKAAAANRQGADGRIVTYNGRELFFPKGSDHGMVESARQNAEKISAWLSDQIEEPVAVRAVISLPGWTVRRTSPEGIPVVNPKQFASLFEHIQPWQLPKETIERIVRLLQKVRSSLNPNTV